MNLLDLARTALPCPDVPTATSVEAAELRNLIARVAADWPSTEREEALAAALADPEAALVCFRKLAEAIPPPAAPFSSGMRTCLQCANLARDGRCQAAARGESFGAGIAVCRRYKPATDMAQRCACYLPGADDQDRRPGRERWPFLLEPRT